MTAKSHKFFSIAVILIMLGLVVWVMYFRLPFYYSAEPVSGRVVDADSGRPLEDAIVIAIWELERGFGMEGGILAGYMDVQEVLTDREGNFFIHGWGPSRRPAGTYLGHNAPRLIVFKEGYNYFARGNVYDSIFEDRRKKSRHRSSWDGETISLDIYTGDLKGYSGVLWRLSANLKTLMDPLFGAGECDWQKIPEMIKTFDEYDRALAELGLSTVLIPDVQNLNWENRCTGRPGGLQTRE